MKQKVKHLVLWWTGQASRIARSCLRLVVVSATLRVSCPGETPVPHKSDGWSPDTLFTHISYIHQATDVHDAGGIFKGVNYKQIKLLP